MINLSREIEGNMDHNWYSSETVFNSSRASGFGLIFNYLVIKLYKDIECELTDSLEKRIENDTEKY